MRYFFATISFVVTMALIIMFNRANETDILLLNSLFLPTGSFGCGVVFCLIYAIGLRLKNIKASRHECLFIVILSVVLYYGTFYIIYIIDSIGHIRIGFIDYMKYYFDSMQIEITKNYVNKSYVKNTAFIYYSFYVGIVGIVLGAILGGIIIKCLGYCDKCGRYTKSKNLFKIKVDENIEITLDMIKQSCTVGDHSGKLYMIDIINNNPWKSKLKENHFEAYMDYCPSCKTAKITLTLMRRYRDSFVRDKEYTFKYNVNPDITSVILSQKMSKTKNPNYVNLN